MFLAVFSSSVFPCFSFEHHAVNMWCAYVHALAKNSFLSPSFFTTLFLGCCFPLVQLHYTPVSSSILVSFFFWLSRKYFEGLNKRICVQNQSDKCIAVNYWHS